MNSMRNKSKVLYSISALILIIVLVISGFLILKPTLFSKEVNNNKDFVSKTVTRDGVEYFSRQDITTFLLLGIDEYGPVESSGMYMNNGESDVVLLVVFDEKNEKYDIISLNRDTMVEMPVLGVGNKQAGTRYGQLALAHTYGTGLEDSCENAKTTISDMFNGLFIDYYASFNMDVISILTEAVDGVKVNVTEDFSFIDSTIGQGEITLTGEQAISFVQIRKEIGDQMNVSRMERQKEFLIGFIDSAMNKLDSGDSFLRNTYSKISPYMVTDCSLNSLISMFEKYESYTLGEIIIPEGENVKGEKYMEFYLNEEAFDKTVIDIFYAEK